MNWLQKMFNPYADLEKKLGEMDVKLVELNKKISRLADDDERKQRLTVIPLLKGIQMQNYKTQDALKKIDLRVK